MKLKSVLLLVKNPGGLYRTLLQRRFPGGLLSDKEVIKRLYKQRFGKNPNLTNPITFNEKLLWLTIHDRKPEYITMVDKYRAKEYIREKVGLKYVVRNYGVWRDSSEIDFDNLPDSYVLKCNHDSGSVVVCNRRKPTEEELHSLDKALKKNYYYFSREWAYKDVKPVIFAEEFIESEDLEKGIVDYKFYCFNGVPKYVLVMSHRTSGGLESYFDIEWNLLNVSKGYMRHKVQPNKPQRYEEMVEISRKLSEGTTFLRVDLFEDVNGNIKVGELTLTPSSGMVPFEPPEYDYIFGDNMELNSL